ncbi:hypothetical protein FUAX_24390 [Fulvitalea axinellae]|uniref:Tail sheath protein C-terminal domain-containing protein n=1 Tax=Fulvitalea axinellae TaxID=1182444 RepID=A0AAU9CSR0_9BACT|nr:hypothetical protein FUAX_24390 [Fulvitalea axinellae]
MAQVLSTPGVYVEEKSAFSTSVVPVATAMPAFLGYTEKAARGSKSLLNVPTKISSLSEYHQLFGGAPKIKHTIAAGEGGGYTLEVDKATDFKLYNSLRLFYANGGGSCYIVSLGDYSSEVKSADFTGEETAGGLQALLREPEPTMLLAPDSLLLAEEDFNSLQQQFLMHCGKDTKSRVALLEVFGGDQPRTMDDEDVIKKFRNGIGTNFLDFGATYYPWLNTTIVKSDELDFTNLANPDGLVSILTANVTAAVEAGKLDESKSAAMQEIFQQLTSDDANVKNLHNTLLAISPLYKQVLSDIRHSVNVMAPAAAMAGVYSMVDKVSGIQKAPANVSLGAVVSPTVNITSKMQEDLNLPLDGKAVNAIRPFPGKGVLVWGARTLDGNSQDWRYVNVRRTLLFIEQTIKNGAERFVFEPNTPSTWNSVTSTIANALNKFWTSGILTGNSTTEAFSVQVGLGSTMTATDILDGIMRITVKVAIARPAEFIVITFQQQMAGADAAGGSEGGEE